MLVEANAWINRFDTGEDDHYSQAGNLYRLMNESQKDQLASNIVDGFVHATDTVKKRILEQFEKADQDYSARVEKAMLYSLS